MVGLIVGDEGMEKAARCPKFFFKNPSQMMWIVLFWEGAGDKEKIMRIF
jgi:hypothetical protein